MRLTKKNNGTGSWTQLGDKYLPAHNVKNKECVNKLGKLEDIEEKIRIGLVTLFKAFNGLYYRKDNEIKFSWHIALVDWTIYILEESVEIGKGVGLGLTEYGKTWALTKEELLND